MKKTHQISKGSPAFVGLLVSAILLLPFCRAQAVDGSWTPTSGGTFNWADATNWSSNPSVAGGADSDVTIQSNIGSSQTITLGSTPQIVGILRVGDSVGTGGFTFSAASGGNLTFQRTGGAQLRFDQGGGNVFGSSIPITLNSDLTIANNVASSQQLNSVISGTGGIIHTAGRIAFINFSANTFSGGYNLNGGTAAIQIASNLGTGPITLTSGTLEAASGGGINLSNQINLGGSITRAGSSSSLAFTSTVTLTANSTITTSGSGSMDISGNVTGAFNLTKTGSQQMVLSGNNSGHSGFTEVQQGDLRLFRNGGAISDSGQVRVSGGTLTLVAFGDTIGSLVVSSGTVAMAGGSPVLSASSFSFTDSGSVTGILGGSGALSKSGSGIVTLSAANTFGGGTTVSAGTLLINNTTGSGVGSGSVTVNGGKLGGSGAFSGSLTVNSGGVLSPGSSIETLGSGALAFSSNSTFEYEVDSGVALAVGADLQKVTGGLSLNGTVTLTPADLAASPVAFALNTKFTLFNYSGIWNGGLFTVGGNTISDEGTFTIGLNTWQLDYNAVSGGQNFSSEYAGGNFVNITAVVPEPSTWGFVVATLVVTILFRPRRRKVEAA